MNEANGMREMEERRRKEGRRKRSSERKEKRESFPLFGGSTTVLMGDSTLHLTDQIKGGAHGIKGGWVHGFMGSSFVCCIPLSVIGIPIVLSVRTSVQEHTTQTRR